MKTPCLQEYQEIDTELDRLTLLITVDLKKKNPLVKQYVQKLRTIAKKIRELQKCHRDCVSPELETQP